MTKLRKLDLGDRFNRWTAVRFVEKRGERGGNHFWLFKCDCGNERLLLKSSVTSGASKSCGCLRTELQQNVEPGETFNRLTAVKRADKEGYWHFRCVCGIEKAIKVYGVRTGDVKSCGCLRDQRNIPKINVGDLFGKLTAFRSLNGGNSIWIFKCACGVECSPRIDRVVNGRVKSCGCRRLIDKSGPRRSGTESKTTRISRMFATRKMDARKRGISFNILKSDIAELFEKQSGKCAQTGITFDLAVGIGARPFGPSLDRIDNCIGYTPDNIQLVCFMYNCAKGAFTDDDVLAFAYALAEQKQKSAINKLKLRVVK